VAHIVDSVSDCVSVDTDAPRERAAPPWA
jgi:hypothetical protein